MTDINSLNILVLDDDPSIRRTLEILLTSDGHTVEVSGSGEEALEKCKLLHPDAAFVDLQLPGMSGIEFIKIVRENHPEMRPIIITAYGSIETAVSAMREGAFDYLTKPFSPQEVRHRISRLNLVLNLEKENTFLKRRVRNEPFSGEFLTTDDTLKEALGNIEKIAVTDAPVHISGESGTGKSFLARLIHDGSHRKAGPFAAIDCTAFHENLLESELFGHKKGAFTGAVSDKPGKVEMAQGGTLFLDEIGEIPLHLQAKLLRLVEENKFERLGENNTRTLDTRIISATNRNLEEMVSQKLFREDLFYRLCVVDVYIPPLRSRPGDIIMLLDEFIARYRQRHSKKVSGWDSDFEKAVLSYAWPGNVRELSRAVERAVLFSESAKLAFKNLPKRVQDGKNIEGMFEFRTLSQLEEETIKSVLALGKSMEETAEILGIDTSTLWRKRKKLGI